MTAAVPGPWLSPTAHVNTLERDLRDRGWMTFWRRGALSKIEGLLITAPDGKRIEATGRTPTQMMQDGYAQATEYAAECIKNAVNDAYDRDGGLDDVRDTLGGNRPGKVAR